MRHLILTLDFPPLQDGGVARSMDETARALAAAGESVRIVTRGRGGEVRMHDAAYPAPVTRLWGHHWQKVHPLWLRLHLPSIAKAEPGAIVHTSTWEIAPAVLRLADKAAWKLVVHAQGREIARTFTESGEQERLRSVLQAANAVLPISRHMADLAIMAGAAREKVHFIPPSVDARRVQGGNRERFRARFKLGVRPVLLTLARLIDRKGQDTVIRALPRVLREIPDLVYVLAGQGSYREALEALARECGVADHVVFAGFVSDAEVPDVYAGADLYAMVSREGRDAGDIEGFGITYLEASAAGLPVLAGRSGGTADAVEEGVSGLLVDPGSVEAVGDAIVSLLRDRSKARAMGEAGRVRAERDFSLASRAAKLIRVAKAL